MKYLFLFSVLLIQSFCVLSKKETGTLEMTDYTLDNLKEYEPVECDNDEDCPSFSRCFVDKTNEKTCRYKPLICKEGEKCFYLSAKIKGKQMYTCHKDAVDRKICKTEKCKKNEDCFSGFCYKNSCASEKEYIECRPNEKHENECKKVDGMLCENDDECGGICDKNVCRSDRGSLLNTIGYTVLFYLLGECVVRVVKHFVPQTEDEKPEDEKTKEAKDNKSNKSKKSNKLNKAKGNKKD